MTVKGDGRGCPSLDGGTSDGVHLDAAPFRAGWQFN